MRSKRNTIHLPQAHYRQLHRDRDRDREQDRDHDRDRDRNNGNPFRNNRLRSSSSISGIQDLHSQHRSRSHRRRHSATNAIHTMRAHPDNTNPSHHNGHQHRYRRSSTRSSGSVHPGISSIDLPGFTYRSNGNNLSLQNVLSSQTLHQHRSHRRERRPAPHSSLSSSNHNSSNNPFSYLRRGIKSIDCCC